MKTIRNLHEAEIRIQSNALAMGASYLDAVRLDDGQYIYRAPETRSNWLVSEDSVRNLGAALIESSDAQDSYQEWCSGSSAIETSIEIPES